MDKTKQDPANNRVTIYSLIYPNPQIIASFLNKEAKRRAS